MPYYETLRQDIERAKEILAKGQVQPEVRDLPAPVRDVLAAHDVKHGTIYGADVFAAYMLLASFVEVIETMDVKVCELALRARKRGQELGECVCRSSHCGHPASQHHNGVCEVCNRGICWC